MTEKNVSLALSGGGVRAMAVHLGLLRYLAELGQLERVTRISTVSGGSLAVGLVIAQANNAWPSSARFLGTVFSAVRAKLCSRSLIVDALWQLKDPGKWSYLLSRANLLGAALAGKWGLGFPLRELPSTPEWSINATTAESGKRFRFKGCMIGDYEAGYAEAGDLLLSTALAVSAAFPGLIGPLALETQGFTWKRRGCGYPEQAAQAIQPAFGTLHLYDGGVYDNLGLEPFFDVGSGTSKSGKDIIIASDAGAPFGEGFSSSVFSPWRLKRVVDIMGDQSRNLRVRSFVDYIKRTGTGAFLQIDSRLLDRQLDSAAELTCRFPTTLRQLTECEFDLMSGHGYAVAKRVNEVYGMGISS